MSMMIVHSENFQKEANSLQAHFKDLIDTVSITSFAQANAICLEAMPDIILAQTELADGNVFDFCTRIRLLQDQKSTPLIVFSEKNDRKERIRTFQVGADEYVHEFDLDYITAVVQHELESKAYVDELSAQTQQASNLVMEAMTSTSELGSAINFIERCHRFQSIETIAKEVVTFCKTLDLKVVIATLEDKHWNFSSSSQNVTDLEQELMQTIHGKQRILDFGVRTQFNWPNIALLVKNMPLREPEKYGRIKDLLPSLLSSANVRIHVIREEERIKEQTELMTRSIEALQPSIEEVIDAMSDESARYRAELSEFLQNIIITLPQLGLEEDQEEFFISHVETLIENADAMALKNQRHQKTLKMTNHLLSDLLAKQTELHKVMNEPIETSDENEEGNDDLFELF
jgi:CheY-like chemotaxis protein